jgi:hypothetical protein
MKTMPKLTQWVLLSAVCALWGCGPQPPTSISDPRLGPFIKAIEATDRAPLGFSPISSNARVQLEEGGRAPYDAMLHIYAETSRTVAFRKEPHGYKWIAEQESFYGPKSFTNIDGTFQEFLVIEFQIERVNGIPTNELRVSYYGEDPRLVGQEHLTLTTIKPILKEWKGKPIR